MRRHPAPFFAAMIALLSPCTLPGQCTPQWVLAPGLGVTGVVHEALEWDPDGTGPLPPRLVVAGEFAATADGSPANNLAFFDYASAGWSTAGSGTDGPVRALTIDHNGHLIAGGDFTMVDGVVRPGIARWDGTAWHDLGTGIHVARSGVHALLSLGNSIVAGGDFDFAGGAAAGNIALWDGTLWTQLGGGLTHTAGHVLHGEPTGVRDLLATATGVVAVGSFDRSGSTVLDSVAELQLAGWQPIGTFPAGSFSSAVMRSVAGTANGELFVAGSDQSSYFVFRWDGATWTSMPGFGNRPHTIATTATGEVLLGGLPIFTGTTSLQRLNGSSWQTIATLSDASNSPHVRCITELPSLGNRLLVAGALSAIDGTAVSGVTIQQPGSGWLGDEGRFSHVPRFFAGPEGELLVSKAAYYGSSTLGGLARWNGTTFVAIPGAPSNVHDVDFDGRGGFVATATTGVHRWQAGVWTSLGLPQASPKRVAVTARGDLFVADGLFQRWTGSYWQYLNQPTSGGDVVARSDGSVALTDPFGQGGFSARVYVYRPFLPSGQWLQLGSPSDLDAFVLALAVTTDDEVIVGGEFTLGNHVVRWDGSAWQPMGAGFDARVEQLHASSDGRVLALGAFTSSGTTACPGAAIWNGSTWQPLSQPGLALRAATAHANGDFWACTDQLRLARLQTPCPANAATTNPGCDQLRLVSTAWPMLGSLHRALGSGLPGSSLVVSAFGTASTSAPLPSLLPFGQAGCDLALLPEVLQVSLPVGDHLLLEFTIPNASTLIGATFLEQLVTIELDASAAPIRARSSNSLALTIGSNQ
ncbi:MAG: hypothetical protein R3F29_01365 [Planctomycetota bacterium]